MAWRHTARRIATRTTLRGYVQGLSHDGRGIARLDGKTVFIEGALPGEEVDFTILRHRREYAEARVADIHKKSAERRSPYCRHFGICGGCALQHLSPAAQIASKQQTLLDNLKRIGRVQPQVIFTPVTGSEWGYRRRARLSARNIPAQGCVHVGFVEKHAKRITNIQHCETLHPKIGHLIGSLAILIGELSIAERVPQIEIAIGEVSTVLVLRILAQPDSLDLRRLSEFEQAHGLRFYLQPGNEGSAVPLNGEPAPLSYSLPHWDLEIAFEPADFIQVNGEINQRLILLALEEMHISSQHQVLDLFSGLGNFTLPLARVAKLAVGVEGAPGLVDRARANAERNSLSNIEFHQTDLFADELNSSWMRQTYDRLLLDPPRAGAREILACMHNKLPPRIVYVSCHPATLARDAGYLVHECGYELLSAGVVDMFPHTAHVESMAVFARAGSPE